MIPQKKDLALSMTTNIFMNTTTKYVPVPITSTEKPSSEKLKQQYFVYRPPVPKNKNTLQNQDKSQIKPSIDLNPKTNGIQMTKVSDLGSSSIFKGLDGFNAKPAQRSDRNKPQKVEQKSVLVNSGLDQDRFERSKKKLNEDSVSSSQQKAVSPKNQPAKLQVKQVQQSNNGHFLVRKPLGRVQQHEEKVKQVQKSPIIKRKNQVETKNVPAQEESFTTQTSSYVYKPNIKRTSATKQTSQINNAQTKTNQLVAQKKQESKNPQPKLSVSPVQQNIYAKNRTRESKQIELSFQINTDVSYFQIQTKGSTISKSLRQDSSTGQVKDNSIVSNQKPQKLPVSLEKNISVQQKSSIGSKVETQNNNNTDSDKKIQKQVPYYMKTKVKLQENKQTTQQQKNEQLKSPPKTINKPAVKQSSDSKEYVYKPKIYQSSAVKTKIDQPDPVQSKGQVESKPLNTESKPVTYQTPKQKQEGPKESVKTASQAKTSPIKSNQTIQTKSTGTENNPIVKTTIPNQFLNSNVPSKTYFLKQNNQQPTNKDQKQSESVQPSRPSLKYNPTQQKPVTTVQPSNSSNIKIEKPIQKSPAPLNLPNLPIYLIKRKPVPTQLQTQAIKQQVPPKITSPKNLQTNKITAKPQQKITISTIQNSKTNTQGYVYQPPNRKITTPNIQLIKINQDVKNSNDASTTPIPVPPVNQRSQIAKKNESTNEYQFKPIQQHKNTKNQGLKQNINKIGNQSSKISPVYPRKQQQTQIKKEEISYTNKRNSQQPPEQKIQPQKPQKMIENKLSQTKPTVYRPTYLQNKKQPEVTSKPISSNAINETNKQQQLKYKIKSIPNSAFSIFSILIRKKLRSNLKFSFNQISQSTKSYINRNKLINSLAHKSFTFSSNYQSYLKTQAFSILKKTFLSSLLSPILGNQIGQSRNPAAKGLVKTKETKQESQLFILTNNNRKIMCLKLQSIFNSKIREVFKDKILLKFEKYNYTVKKSPLFQVLLKIFAIKTQYHLSNAFAKINFNFSYVSKFNDTDLLPLFETKNKKLSKQQITKYLQNIYQTVPLCNTTSRSSLLQKTPQKGFTQKKQATKSLGTKIIEPSAQKSESQKIVSLRTRIENLQKEKNQQQKLTRDKESEIVSKKLQLKRQINGLKKESEQKKKENQQLKQKLKKYEVFNNFGDPKDLPILRAQNDIFGKDYGVASNNNIATSESSEFLNILCNFYIENVLKRNTSNRLQIVTFLRMQSSQYPSFGEYLSYLLNPQDLSGFPTLKQDQLMKANLDCTRDLINQRILVQQNLLLKAQISSIQSQFTEQGTVSSANDSPKVQKQVDTIKSLVKNYIKERYLWEWIRNSISKI